MSRPYDAAVALDFETTGYNPKTCEIIEIGAVLVVDGVSHDFEQLVKITTPVPTKVVQLTGITDLDLEVQGTCLIKALLSFKDFVYSRCEHPVFIGHNILRYDLPIVNRLGTTAGLSIDSKHCYDTLSIEGAIRRRVVGRSYRKLQRDIGLVRAKKNEDSFSLEASCIKHGIVDLENMHRALPDASRALKLAAKQVALRKFSIANLLATK